MLFSPTNQVSAACQSCLVASAVPRPRVESFFLHPSVTAAGAGMSFAGAGAIAIRNRGAQKLDYQLSLPVLPVISSISSLLVLRSLSKHTAMLIQPVALAATTWTLVRWTDSLLADKSKMKDAESENENGALPLQRKKKKDIAMEGDDGSDKKPLTSAMVSTIGIYKNFISPLLPPACRFVPTCSQYGVQAIEEFGPTKGAVLTAWRLLRCSPFGGKGYDPPRWPPVEYTYSSY